MSDPNPQMPVAAAPHVDESLFTYTHVMHGLHSLAAFIGRSLIGSLPSIVAVVMNYARRSATHGTLLESHFRWQLRTFWFAVLWACVSGLVMLTSVGILLGLLVLCALAIWIVYRLVRGWLALRDRKPMYA